MAHWKYEEITKLKKEEKLREKYDQAYNYTHRFVVFLNFPKIRSFTNFDLLLATVSGFGKREL